MKDKIFFAHCSYKEDSSTADSLTKVLSHSRKSFSQAQTSNNSKLLLFIYLKKTLDKIDSSRIFEVLQNRCKDEIDMHILRSIGELHLIKSIAIGQHEIITFLGVAQGSILALSWINYSEKQRQPSENTLEQLKVALEVLRLQQKSSSLLAMQNHCQYTLVLQWLLAVYGKKDTQNQLKRSCTKN